MAETFFGTLWVQVPPGQGRPASRKRVLRGRGATPAAKRTQPACEPRDGAPKSVHFVEAATVRLVAGNTEASSWVWRRGSAGV